MLEIFNDFLYSLGGFASDPSYFLPFLIITPMLLVVFAGIVGFVKE